MKVDQLSNSNYITKADVDPPVRVTVAEPKPYPKNMAKDGHKEDIKLIINLQEFKKPFVCNTTNFNLIAHETGEEDSDNWVGKQFNLFYNPAIEFGDKIVGGIRVLIPQPTMPQAPVAPPAEDEVPF